MPSFCHAWPANQELRQSRILVKHLSLSFAGLPLTTYTIVLIYIQRSHLEKDVTVLSNPVSRIFKRFASLITMFSIILPGRPCLTDIQNISANQFAFSFPAAPHFSHIVVFMLPGNNLPDGTAAGVFLQLPGEQQFKFLGGLANEKQSAIFKVNLPEVSGSGVVNLGVSVEPIANIEQQIIQLKNEQHASSTAVAKAKPSTKVLAQRIIQNAFNFLSSFSGNAGGTEVVPLKSFQDWWTKFERRIENDPSFLERAES